MSRIHGKKGALYVQLLAADSAAAPVAFLNAWAANFTTDFVEDTTFDDDNKVYLAGLPDSTGTFGGFYDDATPQTYEAARDGVARKFYLYPSRLSNGKYWFGTGFFDFSASGGTAQAVTVSGNWRAASNVSKIG